jgi:hypothetical protein
MASERLFRISSEAVRTGNASPAVSRPFLFSQVGHYFSMPRRHRTAKTVLVTPGTGSKFLSFFFASDARSVQQRQIRARLSNKIRAWVALIGGTDFRSMLRTHRSSSRSCSLGDREIRQRPTQTETCEDPALFSVQHFFMARAVLKHEDFIKKPLTLKLLDPVCFVRGFFLSQNRVPSWTIKAVARLSNVTNLTRSRINKSIDDETADVFGCHATSSFSRRAVKAATAQKRWEMRMMEALP